mmetsp:Transcript_25966/g.85387  ORF Transcript_25966/g.85387 Transcript_25966/m.85387 type:complete len:310 (-) Transcript_25966:388-1317(-)
MHVRLVLEAVERKVVRGGRVVRLAAKPIGWNLLVRVVRHQHTPHASDRRLVYVHLVRIIVMQAARIARYPVAPGPVDAAHERHLHSTSEVLPERGHGDDRNRLVALQRDFSDTSSEVSPTFHVCELCSPPRRLQVPQRCLTKPDRIRLVIAVVVEHSDAERSVRVGVAQSSERAWRRLPHRIEVVVDHMRSAHAHPRAILPQLLHDEERVAFPKCVFVCELNPAQGENDHLRRVREFLRIDAERCGFALVAGEGGYVGSGGGAGDDIPERSRALAERVALVALVQTLVIHVNHHEAHLLRLREVVVDAH